MSACPPDSLHHLLPPLHSSVQCCRPLCGPLCMSQSSLFWSYTLAGMCTCISKCMHVHLAAHIGSTPFAQLCANMYPCVVPYACSNYPSSGPTSWLECGHASVHVCISTDSHFCSIHFTVVHKFVHLCAAPHGCPSYPSSGSINCLEYVHPSVHVCMITYLSMSVPLPLRYCVQKCTPLYNVPTLPSHSSCQWLNDTSDSKYDLQFGSYP